MTFVEEVLRNYGRQHSVTDVVNTHAVGDTSTVHFAQRSAVHSAVSCSAINWYQINKVRNVSSSVFRQFLLLYRAVWQQLLGGIQKWGWQQLLSNWFSTLHINSIYKDICPVHLYLSVISVRGFSTVRCTGQELLESLMLMSNLLIECCWDKSGGQAPCRTNCYGCNKLHSHRESWVREVYICV